MPMKHPHSKSKKPQPLGRGSQQKLRNRSPMPYQNPNPNRINEHPRAIDYRHDAFELEKDSAYQRRSQELPYYTTHIAKIASSCPCSVFVSVFALAFLSVIPSGNLLGLFDRQPKLGAPSFPGFIWEGWDSTDPTSFVRKHEPRGSRAFMPRNTSKKNAAKRGASMAPRVFLQAG